MPHIIVKLWPGKSDDQKQELADAITADVTRTLGYGPDSVSVGFEEVDAANWRESVYLPDVIGKEQSLYKKPGYKM